MSITDTHNGFACMMEACSIFMKYTRSHIYAPFHCEHDKLSVVGITPSEVSVEDAARLAELGFHVPGFDVDPGEEPWYDDPDDEYIYSFRFGSA